jgi:NDP-sugar pyrophosphorylase family protein
MKAIILAAGKGTRMRPLTDEVPKPLIRTIQSKPLLAHIMDVLPQEIDEVVLVVGYKRDQIIAYFGHEYIAEDSRGLRISYVVQEEAKGTFAALDLCRHFINPTERFLMLYGDDLIDAESVAECIQSKNLALLYTKVSEDKASKFGILEVDDSGFVRGIEEKPLHPKSRKASVGVMVLDGRVFKYPPEKSADGEYVLADAVSLMIAAGIQFQAVSANVWIPVGSIQELNEVNANRLERRRQKDRRAKPRPGRRTAESKNVFQTA